MKKRLSSFLIIQILSAIILFALIALFLLLIFESTIVTTVYYVFLGITIFTFITILLYLNLYYQNNKKATKNFFSLFSDVEESFELNVNGGFMIYDNKDRVIFISKWLYENGFKNFLGKKINLFFASGSLIEDSGTNFHWKNSIYSIKKNNKNKMLIFKDNTNVAISNQIIKKRDLCLIIIDKYFSNKVADKVKINLNLNDYLTKWAEKYNGIIRLESVFDNSLLILVKWNKISVDILQKGLMDKIMEILGQNSQNISISIGASYGNSELIELFENAKDAIEKAKGRGGNQVIIYDERNKIINLGESTQKDQDNSKVELKFFNDNLINTLKEFNRIFITAHNMADIDALSSTIGISKFVKEYNKNVNILLEDFDNSASKIFKNLSTELKSLFINQNEIKEKINRKTGIIILDTSEKNRTQAFQIVEEIEVENRIILDHHRTSFDKIETKKENSYIDTASSSTSEIITELFMFKENRDYEHLSKEEASLLILGIYLDTNNLKRNTSSRTYEVLTFLSNQGGEINNLIDYTKSDFLNTPLIVDALEKADRISPEIIFSHLDETKIIDESTLSFLANMLLDYEGIKASFILAKINKNTYKMSARSNGNINVQLICEKLGGGGHFNIAAVTFDKSDMKFKNLRKKIRDTITETLIVK